MGRLKLLLDILTIAVIVILPHTGIIPNFLYSLPILLLTWIALKYANTTFSDIGFSFNRINTKSLLIGVIVAIGTLAFMQLIFFPILGSFVSFQDTDFELYDFIKESRGQYIFIIIMGWLIGGFYEEIVFHGFIFSRLEKIFSHQYATQISFALTSILFGAYHFPLGAEGLINALVVGAIYLTLHLYFKRNLWYSIFCHGIYNTLVVTLIYHGYL